MWDEYGCGGFLAPLRSLSRDWSGVVPVILGCGGAARAVVVGCAELGCPEIRVVGRNQEKLEQFLRSWSGTGLRDKVKVFGWQQLSGLIAETGLVVNATPIGMSPKVDQSPLGAVEVGLLGSGAIVYDLIYVPRPTLLLRQVAEKGGGGD